MLGDLTLHTVLVMYFRIGSFFLTKNITSYNTHQAMSKISSAVHRSAQNSGRG